MKCKICGRNLKNTASMQAGYGPVCYRKVFGRSMLARGREHGTLRQHNTKAGDSTYCIPGQMNLEDYL